MRRKNGEPMPETEGESGVKGTDPVDALIAPPEEPAKKKRGRPKGSPNKKAGVPAAELANEMTSLVRGGFALIAARKGKHWELTEEEAGVLGQSYARVFAKYESKLEYLPEVTALLATVGVIVPRVFFAPPKPKPEAKPVDIPGSSLGA